MRLRRIGRIEKKVRCLLRLRIDHISNLLLLIIILNEELEACVRTASFLFQKQEKE